MVTWACSGWSGSYSGAGTCSTSRSSSGSRSSASAHPEGPARPAGPGVAVDDGEVDLRLVGVEVEEQLVDLVDDLVDAGVGTVDLVDDQDHRQPRLQRLAQHEPRLRQRPLAGVDQQQHAVDHRQPALDLAAEVGVAGGVDDVELDPAVADRGVLGQDRDPLLALEVHRVEHPLGHVLVGAEGARLPQQGVHQRRLAVVDVGDDRDVADVGPDCHGAALRLVCSRCHPPLPPPHGHLHAAGRARCRSDGVFGGRCAGRRQVPGASRVRDRAGERVGGRHLRAGLTRHRTSPTPCRPAAPSCPTITVSDSVAGQLHRHDQRPGAERVHPGRCGVFADFAASGPLGSFGQQPGTGCVYPSDVPTLPSQLTAAGLTRRSYDEDMGADPSRESATCGHPVVGQPDHTEADAHRHVRQPPRPVRLFPLDHRQRRPVQQPRRQPQPAAADLAHVSSTRNYTFITPNLCNDGHDATCANGQTGGLPAADAFLKTWVPRITASQAARRTAC